MIPIRFYLFAGLAAFIAFALWHDHRSSKLLKARTAELTQVRADAAAERLARKHEKDIADAATNQFQTTVANLQADLAARPLKPVYIRVPVSAVPQANRPTSASTGADEAAEGRVTGEAEKDIGPDLTSYALDCQINTLQLESLQSWVRAR